MKVSVAIPAFNQADYLREALASALAQTHSDLELLVVDDGSTDHTRAVCESFADPRIRYIHQPNDGTRGLGARNAAMIAASGEWIALLDQDDLWAPDKIEKQLRRAAEQPAAGSVFCRVRFIDEKGVMTGEQPDELPEGEVLHALLFHNRYYVSSGMFRRSLLNVAGLPDESSGFADWALWVSLARHAPVAVLREPLADYREHAQSFLGQMSGASQIRKLEAHLTTLLRNALRAHPDCEACRHAIRTGRIQTAKQALEIARRTVRNGDFSALAMGLRFAWRAAPFWLARPWTFLAQFLRLLAGVPVALVRKARRG